ncbi:hypothetical protein L484_028072 [Morus notabilis]|uniref:Uncharacterized protein n=1 Tax=Morus notabilis TaxID=981085 RepID=W9SG05_9ROSA|nr:hypothetical protein L484_028072 [Morus notabilis]
MEILAKTNSFSFPNFTPTPPRHWSRHSTSVAALLHSPTCLPSLPLPQLAQPIVATCPPLTSPKPLPLVRESRGNGRFSLRDFKSFQRHEPEPFLLTFSTVAKEPKEEMKELIRLF